MILCENKRILRKKGRKNFEANKRNPCETDLCSLRFALKRKKNISENLTPYPPGDPSTIPVFSLQPLPALAPPGDLATIPVFSLQPLPALAPPGDLLSIPVFSLQPLPALAPPGDPALSHVLHKISDDSSRSPKPASASVRLSPGKFADEHFARVVAAGAHSGQRVVGPLPHTDGTVGVAAGRQAPNWGKDDIPKVPLTRLRCPDIVILKML